MAIENVKLVLKSCPQHLRMCTARMNEIKSNKGIEEGILEEITKAR